MKNITVCLVFTVLFFQAVQSQDSVKPKETEAPRPTYFIRLDLLRGQTFSAHLMDIKDSSVFVFQKKSAAPDPFHKGNSLMNIDSNWDQYNYRFITSMKVRNKSLRTWTILGGAVAGMVGGVLIAKNSKEEGVYSTTAVILGFLLGGGVGAVAGVIVASSVEKKYLINGDWKSFEDLKAVLKY